MEDVQNFLDSLVRHWAAGLVLNTSETVALTTEAQPPSFIQVGDNHMIKVLRHAAHSAVDGKAFNMGQWSQEIPKAGWLCCLISLIL